MDYPEDISKTAESIIEQCYFYTPTHYRQVKEFAAKALMNERESCAKIAETEMLDCGDAVAVVSGEMIASAICCG